MAAIHYRARRTPVETEVDAAFAAAERDCQALDARLDELGLISAR